MCAYDESFWTTIPMSFRMYKQLCFATMFLYLPGDKTGSKAIRPDNFVFGVLDYYFANDNTYLLWYFLSFHQPNFVSSYNAVMFGYCLSCRSAFFILSVNKEYTLRISLTTHNMCSIFTGRYPVWMRWNGWHRMTEIPLTCVCREFGKPFFYRGFFGSKDMLAMAFCPEISGTDILDAGLMTCYFVWRTIESSISQ